MVEIIEVKTKKQRKQFVDFPTKLYEGNPYYVHPLRGDELGIFTPKKNVSFDECDIIFFLAMREGEVVGRICGILQKVYNLKTGTKRVRFGRFDFIDDIEVPRALLGAVEEWAKSKGMDTIHGPLGFNDLEREGLLIEGFDRLATFEANYNYPYYKDLIEQCGYEKEIDYISSRVQLPKETNERAKRLADAIMKRYNLRIAKAKNIKEYLKKYKDGIFEVLDEAYGDLYGVIPYNERLKKSIIDQFKMVINMNYIISVLDENDRVVAFGFALPELAHAVQKSKGRLFPLGVFRILYARNHGNVADFGLIGVRKEYANRGLPAIMINYIVEEAKHVGVTTVEGNLTLEDNHHMLQLYKNFDNVERHKRFRCFVKKLYKDEELVKDKSQNGVEKKSTAKKSAKKTSSKGVSKKTSPKKTPQKKSTKKSTSANMPTKSKEA